MGLPAPVTLEQVYQAVLEIKVLTGSMDVRLKELNGTVREHCEDIAVLKDWRSTQANQAIGQVSDLRVEMAKMGAFGGAFGLAAGIVVAVLRAMGV